MPSQICIIIPAMLQPSPLESQEQQRVILSNGLPYNISANSLFIQICNIPAHVRAVLITLSFFSAVSKQVDTFIMYAYTLINISNTSMTKIMPLPRRDKRLSWPFLYRIIPHRRENYIQNKKMKVSNCGTKLSVPIFLVYSCIINNNIWYNHSKYGTLYFTFTAILIINLQYCFPANKICNNTKLQPNY